MIDHLVNTTLRHWDSAMRQLGAQSIRKLCELDLSLLGPRCANRVVRLPFGGPDVPILTLHNSVRFLRCLTPAMCTVASWLSLNYRWHFQLSQKDSGRRCAIVHPRGQTEGRILGIPLLGRCTNRHDSIASERDCYRRCLRTNRK